MATTISYNDYISLQRIYTASSGGTVFSSNLYNTSAFDYFSNSCVVNDAIYFGFDSPRIMFSGLKLYIGTAFASTSVTFVWEYYVSGTGWTALSGVTDGTSNFTATGERTVTWTPPTNSSHVLINSVYCQWVRVRISAINTPTEGGAQSTQIVTARNNGVTISDSGNTVSDFCETAYQADVAGGWGVITKTKSGYYFNCHIFVGYSTDANQTNLSDTGKMIECEGVIWAAFGGTKRSTITLGTLTSEDNKTTANGCLLKFNKNYSSHFAMGSSNENFKLYGCIIQGASPYGVGVAYNCIFYNAFVFLSDYVNNYGNKYFNVFFENRPDFISSTIYENAINDTIVVSGASTGVRCTYQAFIRNLRILGATYFGDVDAQAYPYDVVFIDAESNVWGIDWNSTPSNRGVCIGRHYSFNLKIIDENGNAIEGAKITLKNKDGYNALFCERGRTDGTLNTGVTSSIKLKNDYWATGDYMKIGNEVIYLSGTVSFPYAYNITRAQLGSSESYHSPKQAYKLFEELETDSDGEIEEAIIEAYNYVWLSGTNPGTTTTTDKNPFTLEIRKSGYKTYKTNITISSKFNEIITLQKIKDLNFSKKFKSITQ